jgi:hypothetical protein
VVADCRADFGPRGWLERRADFEADADGLMPLVVGSGVELAPAPADG